MEVLGWGMVVVMAIAGICWIVWGGSVKLYIWNNPYRVAYGGSFLFVAASTLDKAKKIAKDRAKQYHYGEFLHKDWSGNIPLGEPTRIVDLPGGEWYEWSE